MIVLSPLPQSHVAERLEKLLNQRLLNEKNAYQLFLSSHDSFQKELAINLWLAHVQDIAELESVVRQYGGDLPEKNSFKPFTGLPASTLIGDVRKSLEETGEAVVFYEDALKRDWPIDIRMLLQKHSLRCKDILRRLEASFLPHAIPA